MKFVKTNFFKLGGGVEKYSKNLQNEYHTNKL